MYVFRVNFFDLYVSFGPFDDTGPLATCSFLAPESACQIHLHVIHCSKYETITNRNSYNASQ